MLCDYNFWMLQYYVLNGTISLAIDERCMKHGANVKVGFLDLIQLQRCT